MFAAPFCDQNMPDCLQRLPTRVLHPARDDARADEVAFLAEAAVLHARGVAGEIAQGFFHGLGAG